MMQYNLYLGEKGFAVYIVAESLERISKTHYHKSFMILIR